MCKGVDDEEDAVDDELDGEDDDHVESDCDQAGEEEESDLARQSSNGRG